MNPAMLTEDEIRILIVIKAGNIAQCLQCPDPAQRMTHENLSNGIERMRILCEALDPGTKQ